MEKKVIDKISDGQKISQKIRRMKGRSVQIENASRVRTQDTSDAGSYKKRHKVLK